MGIPDVRALVMPTLKALADGVSETPAIRAHLADRFSLTREEREARTGSGQTVFGNRIAFVLRYSGPAGATRKIAPGCYELTELGRTFLDLSAEQAADAILRPATSTMLGQPAPVASATEAPRAGTVVPVTTPPERLDAALAEMDAALAADLLDTLRQISAGTFERLIARLLGAMGYGIPTRHRGGAGDEGIDGIVEADRLGLDRVYVQAKRYGPDNPVGPSKIREFVGALTNAGASKGVFVTSSTFTEAARDALPRGNNAANIALIDGARLVELMIEHGIGVRTERTINVKRLDAQDLTRDVDDP